MSSRGLLCFPFAKDSLQGGASLDLLKKNLFLVLLGGCTCICFDYISTQSYIMEQVCEKICICFQTFPHNCIFLCWRNNGNNSLFHPFSDSWREKGQKWEKTQEEKSEVNAESEMEK